MNKPVVVQTFHIYPVGCLDEYRYSIINTNTDDLVNPGIIIQYEERSEDKPHTTKDLRPYKVQDKLTLDIEDAQVIYECLGRMF
jgi:hypothetical protein